MCATPLREGGVPPQLSERDSILLTNSTFHELSWQHRPARNPRRVSRMLRQPRRTLVLGNLLRSAGRPRSTAQAWQRVVHYPQSTIFEAVARVGDYSLFLPWCMSSRVLTRTEGAAGSETLTTEMGVGFDSGPVPLRSTFRSTVTLEPLTRVRAVSESNAFIDHLIFSWEFAPIGERSTRLDLQLEVGLKSPEHALLWEFAQASDDPL